AGVPAAAYRAGASGVRRADPGEPVRDQGCEPARLAAPDRASGAGSGRAVGAGRGDAQALPRGGRGVVPLGAASGRALRAPAEARRPRGGDDPRRAVARTIGYWRRWAVLGDEVSRRRPDGRAAYRR